MKNPAAYFDTNNFGYHEAAGINEIQYEEIEDELIDQIERSGTIQNPSLVAKIIEEYFNFHKCWCEITINNDYPYNHYEKVHDNNGSKHNTSFEGEDI